MLETKVESIDEKSVSFANADGSDSVEGDLVLVATGRTPNTKGLGLEELGLDIDPVVACGWMIAERLTLPAFGPPVT